MLLLLVFILIHCYTCGQVEARAPLVIDRSLLDAIKQVESGGNPCAIGDNGQSLGAYQIMEAYYNDSVANSPSLGSGGRTYSDVWGIGSEAYSEEVMASYMGRYAIPAAERLGREPTFEDIARIHNGGPTGYQSPQTVDYWERVMAELARQRSGRQTQSGGNNQCSPACTTGQCCSSTGSCNCLSSTFTVQSCTESGTGSMHGQVYKGLMIMFSAVLLCLMAF